MVKTWWLSFCDATRPKGSRFLGACIVAGNDLRDALQAAWAAGCNPGGEVQGQQIEPEDDALVDAKWRCRLLSRAECDAMDRELLDRKAILLKGRHMFREMPS